MTEPIKIENPESAELILSAHPNGGWTVASSHDCCPPQTIAAYGSADAMLADLARVLVKTLDDPLSRVSPSTLRGLVDEREIDRA